MQDQDLYYQISAIEINDYPDLVCLVDLLATGIKKLLARAVL